MHTIAENLCRLRDQVRGAALAAGRDPEEIRLVAVSKTVPPERVREAYDAGQRLFGENRAQELAAKAEALAGLEIAWHFVGHLQTNKVRQVIPLAALVHSLDRGELAEKINLQAPAAHPQPVLIQVNTSGEPGKSGVAPELLPELLDRVAGLPGLTVEGLMTIGPLTEDREEIRAAFRRLRLAIERERARARPRAPLRELSMGMSGDFIIAVEEGATLLRIGTALFGQRD